MVSPAFADGAAIPSMYAAEQQNISPPLDWAEGPEGTPLTARSRGPNDRGSTGRFGMRPPAGDPAHDYHFQVFALDTTLDLPHGASRAELLEAMRGHVLCAGGIVGTYER